LIARYRDVIVTIAEPETVQRALELLDDVLAQKTRLHPEHATPF
jgi:hypothetical protein